MALSTEVAKAIADLHAVVTKCQPTVVEGLKLANALQPVLDIAESADPQLVTVVNAFEAVLAGVHLGIAEAVDVVKALTALRAAIKNIVSAGVTPAAS